MDLPEPLLQQIAGRDLIVFDGVCVLCSGFMRFVHRHDHARRFHFVTAQSSLGEALYAHYGLKSAGDYDTNLVLLDGVLYTRLDAFTAVMRVLGWPWRIFGAVQWLPAPVKDFGYDRIARNRYRLFGRRESCLIPDESLRARFLG